MGAIAIDTDADIGLRQGNGPRQPRLQPGLRSVVGWPATTMLAAARSAATAMVATLTCGHEFAMPSNGIAVAANNGMLQGGDQEPVGTTLTVADAEPARRCSVDACCGV